MKLPLFYSKPMGQIVLKLSLISNMAVKELAYSVGLVVCNLPFIIATICIDHSTLSTDLVTD
jgi:hypothetical protein